MIYWKVNNVIRKIVLTGLIMFINHEDGSDRLFRLIVAISISTLYLGLLALARPYKRINDLHLSLASNILLIWCFLLGVILHVRGSDDDNCRNIIGLPVYSYKATLVTMMMSLLGYSCLVYRQT